ncbi:Amino acid transporter AVT1J [Nymphon striatum]|nr:Amino acid transporter AVT1J [Nymphon striatum]
MKAEMDIIDRETADEGDPLYHDHHPQVTKQLSVKMTFLFIVAEMIGGGVLALPYAVVTAGHFGLLFIVVIGPLSAYGGVKLGRCWQIIIERWPKYGKNIKDPYPTIGEICYGKIVREFVRLNVFFMSFGCNIVLLLFASQLTEALFTAYSISYCYWILVIGVCLIPTIWFEGPKDLWPISIVSLLTAALTILIVIFQISRDVFQTKNTVVEKPELTANAVLISYGTIMFMNGGAAMFPTIQNDMKNKKKFSLAIGLAFIRKLLIPLTAGC